MLQRDRGQGFLTACEASDSSSVRQAIHWVWTWGPPRPGR